MKEAEAIPITSTPTRITGKIIGLNKDGGFGFISSTSKPYTRIFFHWTALNSNQEGFFLSLRKGMNVEFDCIEWFNEEGKSEGFRAIKIDVKD